MIGPSSLYYRRRQVLSSLERSAENENTSPVIYWATEPKPVPTLCRLQKREVCTLQVICSIGRNLKATAAHNVVRLAQLCMSPIQFLHGIEPDLSGDKNAGVEK